jgi:DNA topoisomerase-1
MAKKKQPKKKKPAAKAASGKAGKESAAASGRHLVIVESPAKAKTINKYLGRDFIVKASVGHVRDLPKRNPKGVKDPVPGVRLDGRFTPSYEIIAGKSKTVGELKKYAKSARDVYLATDLDREGEAIAWHLVEALDIPPERAKRVVFNAITKEEIREAFEHPRALNMDKVNAQQARRILDRIVGYQVSPLLWKKVAGGLSAGRVQSVAVRLIAEREREIRAFIPEEYWRIGGLFTPDRDRAASLSGDWAAWLRAEATKDPEGKGPTQKLKERWLSEHDSFAAELAEVDGAKFEPKSAEEALEIARRAGFVLAERQEIADPKGKGPAARRITLIGAIQASPDWTVLSIQTKRTTSKPAPPFITSTLQQAAANTFGYSAQGTMRLAQQLYEGVELPDLGSVGLITYMRTDSTHLSATAVEMARTYIRSLGEAYLPETPASYRSSNQQAQEAHEAVRPTDVNLTPDSPAVVNGLNEQQLKLYRLIWQRFVACQMTHAQWDSTSVRLGTRDEKLVFRASGRRLVFDGFYRVVGLGSAGEEPLLPSLTEGAPLGALEVQPRQHFTSPPPRYSEASLVKTLEAEGIGRPSTYASIIHVIQDRKYVEKVSGRFHCTDLGMVVTEKLTEAFPMIMDVGYTRQMEAELDRVENEHQDWVEMLGSFYRRFSQNLSQAHELMVHAKAATEPAPHKCPDCGSGTMYRFGKNGRFLSCDRYPDCKYGSSIDREGNPRTAEHTDVACPECSTPLLLRTGRFGPFLSCPGYPNCRGIVNIDRKGFVKLPKPPPLETELPCPKCKSPLNLRNGKRGPWLGCSAFPKCRGRLAWTSLEEDDRKRREALLAVHEAAHPVKALRTLSGQAIGESHKPVVQGAEADTPVDVADNGAAE